MAALPAEQQPAPWRAPDWRPGLVALDIDGTLVLEDGELRPEVDAAVQRVRAAGAHVVIATGRTFLGALPVAGQLGLRDGWMVASNGAVTLTLDPLEAVDVVTFDPAAVVRMLRTHLPEALFAAEDVSGGHRITAPFPEGELTGEQRVVGLDELVAEPVTRIVVRSPGSEPRDFEELIARVGLQDVSYAIGYTAWLDLAPRGVSKASALEVVRGRLGVDAAATLAVGDGRNDLEMLGWAACGVAMGQAPAEVQDAADLVTDTVHDDGLARALTRWFP